MFSIAIGFLSFLSISQVRGHGYMFTPRSRNFVASQDGVDDEPQAGLYVREHCTSCLNSNVGDPVGYCGYSPQTEADYTHPVDSVGQPMPWNSEVTYGEGDEIVIEHTYTTHKYGHIEVAACPLGASSTWECFENPAHLLEFVSDENYGMPKDVNYPERGYLKRTTFNQPFKMIFKLPMGVNGDEVLLRWHYVTANSCLPTGYSEYFTWAIANGLAEETDYRSILTTTECVTPYERTGSILSSDDPEQFWNCAEISITPANPTSPPPTTTPTTPAPVNPPTTQAPVSAAPTGGTSNGIPLPCCGWGNGCVQEDNTYCQANEAQCTGPCNGVWYGGSATPAPTPAPGGSGSGCCTWGGWSTCPEWTQSSSDPCQSSASGCNNCSGSWIDGNTRARQLRGGTQQE